MTETTPRDRAVSDEQLARLEDLARIWDMVAGNDDDGHSRGLRLCARQLRQVTGEVRADLDLPVSVHPGGQ